MKKLVLALTALAAFTGSAVAADLPAKAPMMSAPIMAPSWTGFYLFGGFGYGLWEASTTTINPTTGNCILCMDQRQGGNGWYGTVGGGYDWQFNGAWVAGIFADGQFGNIQGTIQDQGPFFAGAEKLKTSWAAGARLGYLVAPNVLSYVNGGYSGSHWSNVNMLGTFIGNPTGFSTPSFNRGGWFLGGGVENSLNIFGFSAPGWFMKTEYRVAKYDKITLPDTNGLGGIRNSITFQPIVQTVSTSLVYRFNWTGPVVAKY
jgi:outer membrane immunogenic protein